MSWPGREGGTWTRSYHWTIVTSSLDHSDHSDHSDLRILIFRPVVRPRLDQIT